MLNLVKSAELRQALFAEVSNILKLKRFHEDTSVVNLSLIALNQMETGRLFIPRLSRAVN